MVDPKLVDELALRTGVSRSDAEALLEALGEIAPGRLSPASRAPACGTRFDASGMVSPAGRRNAPAQPLPDPREIQALIAAAEQHPLGLDFLLDGDLAAVAITFQVHAFSVDAARQHLKRQAP